MRELKALWREYFGVEPPAYRRGFLIRGIAHRIAGADLRRARRRPTRRGSMR